MNGEEESAVSNVSDMVLEAFVDKLTSEEEYSEVAERLKNVIFNDNTSEQSLRDALFDETE
ncbi:MAG: hypothetical protein ACNYPD_00940 [Candidatus Halichondribacter symbioticus]